MGTTQDERDRIEEEEFAIASHPEQKDYAAELFNIPNVEIFASGVWNGDKYTNDDLDIMVEAFNDPNHKLKPFLKLGHNEDQKLLANDGLPAAGFVSNLRRVGDKLVADFVDMPKKIFELVENKAFRKVSSEIFWNIQIAGKKFKRMLSAVALLGADTPAVSSLDDILEMYGIKSKEYEALKQHSFLSMDDKNINPSADRDWETRLPH